MAKEEAAIVDTARIVDSMIRYLMALSSAREQTKLERLMMESMQAIANGDTAFYSTMTNEDAKAISKLLEQKNIPFFCAEKGENTTIFVQEKYVDQLHEIEEMYQFTNLEHFKQCNGLDLTQSLAGAYNNIPVLTYEDEMLAEVAVQKLFNSGITCAMEKNKDGTFDVIMHPNCMYRSGADSDFNSFQLQMAYESVRANGLDLRKAQAAWDVEQINRFAQAAAEGKTVVFADYDATRCDNSLKIKAEDKRLYIMEEGAKHWKEITGGDIQNAEEVRNLCSAYAEKIENNTCFTPNYYKELEAIGRELKKTDKKSPEWDELRKKEKDIIVTALGGKDDSVFRPPHNGKFEKVQESYKKYKKVDKQLQDMLTSIQKDAGRMTKQHMPEVSCVNIRQTMQALEYEKTQIIEMLRAGLNGENQTVVDYIADKEGRKKQIEQIIDALENGSEGLPKMRMTDLGKQLNKELNREKKKEKEEKKNDKTKPKEAENVIE